MSRREVRDLSASVRQRLLNLSRLNRQSFEWVLTRYVQERLLYRLGESPWRDQFVLKGALLFLLWHDKPSRLTRDADLLGTTPMNQQQIEEIFRSLCALEVEEVRSDGPVGHGEQSYEGLFRCMDHGSSPRF